MKVKAIDGLPIIPAKRGLKLKVTPRDISLADTKDPGNCAMARACRRELHVKEARVHLSRVYLRTGDDHWVRYETPKDLRSEIIAFDRGGRFEPGEFLLRAPKPSNLTVQRRKNKLRNAKGGAKRKPPAVVKDIRGGPA